MSENMDHIRAVEATLFASESPMNITEIAAYVEQDVDVAAILIELQSHYEGRGIELVKRGDRWHFQTAADLVYLLRRETDQLRKLSRAAIETLSIIAYHGPVSRAEIESIRGVHISKGTLDVLMEALWIKSAGRRDVPGRPLIYVITNEFLTHFGLSSRKDLPGIRDLKASGLLDPIDIAMEEFDLNGGSEKDLHTANEDSNMDNDDDV